jgi:glyoxalase superfamily protein
MEGSGDNMAAITSGEVDLAFQRVEDYRPPRWPDDEHPKQYHLDFEVGEIEPEQRRVVQLGATLQKDFIGPEGYGWQVFTDPAGHPFCLCRHEGVTWTDKGMVWP